MWAGAGGRPWKRERELPIGLLPKSFFHAHPPLSFFSVMKPRLACVYYVTRLAQPARPTPACFHCTQEHLPRLLPPRVLLGNVQPLTGECTTGLPTDLSELGHFLNQGSLCTNDSSLWQADIKTGSAVSTETFFHVQRGFFLPCFETRSQAAQGDI